MNQKKSKQRSGRHPRLGGHPAKSRARGVLGVGIGKRGPLSPKIFWAGCVLIGLVALGMGRTGDSIPASELRGQGDLFYRKGEKEPFTGTAVSQVAGKKTEAEFWQGRMHGVYQSWFSNGQMEGEAHFDKGVRDGRHAFGTRRGRLSERQDSGPGWPTGLQPNGIRMEKWRGGRLGGLESGMGRSKHGLRVGIEREWAIMIKERGVEPLWFGGRLGKRGRRRTIKRERLRVGGWSGMRMGQSIRRLFLKTAKRVRNQGRVSLEPAGGWD